MIIEEQNKDKILSEIFKVLSEPNRLKMIRILNETDKEMSCSEMSELLSLSLSTVSYHAKALREIGLTNTRREAQTKFLSINRQTFKKYLPGFLDSL
ncbi:transcriptional regulator [Companilactobacillus zhachilii]|uniref:Transcriptional regulator n=1 Tax=Companilactobacillus zhachilii TaxID=2304606 RepID=A0A386PS75_9LACO|nr:metalloregulator ArsR/SmtB family transcription factor [Companilactobacillus zhachilii]AYE38018.1 transcriptional regulator [Companilactobacillus zhachilii]